MKVLVIGPNNCGKGIFAELLSRKTGFQVVECQKELEKNKVDITTGRLIDDEIVNRTMGNINFDKNVILTGYPRTMDQNKYMLDNILKPDLVIVLNISEETVVGRTLGNYICPECGTIVYVNTRKSSKEKSLCHNCGANLQQIEKLKSEEYDVYDHKEKGIREKYNEYMCHTYPIINYYKYSGNNVIVWEFDNSGGVVKNQNDIADYIKYMTS